MARTKKAHKASTAKVDTPKTTGVRMTVVHGGKVHDKAPSLTTLVTDKAVAKRALATQEAEAKVAKAATKTKATTRETRTRVDDDDVVEFITAHKDVTSWSKALAMFRATGVACEWHRFRELFYAERGGAKKAKAEKSEAAPKKEEAVKAVTKKDAALAALYRKGGRKRAA